MKKKKKMKEEICAKSSDLIDGFTRTEIREKK